MEETEGLIPGLGRYPEVGNGSALQYSCLEDSMDRGAGQVTVHSCTDKLLSHFSLYPTVCDPVDCNPPGSSVHGILHARILGWVAMLSSKGSS